jgi:transcriptional regulator with XRE-family HTH domain
MVSVVEAGFLNERHRIMKTEDSPSKLQMPSGAKNLVGLKIRQIREKRGWTQHQLAEAFKKVGILITRDIIANIETQRCAVTDYQIVFFARALAISWKSLFPDKTILDNAMPPICRKTECKSTSNSNHQRQKANFPAPASVKDWSICELTCKSVKMTFRAPS